jgi:hypothetical protein
MSFPLFKDFDKPVSEIFNDDFDLKYTLKIKSALPYDSQVTTNTTYDPSNVDSKLSTKLSLKSEVKSAGFTVEKLEVGVDGHLAVETSLSNAFKGLKLEFKGDDKKKGDLSFQYKNPIVTATGEIDAVGVNFAKGSITSGKGPLYVGGCADFDLAQTKVDKVSVGIAYKIPNVSAVLRSDKTFSDVSGLVSYNIKNFTLAAKGTYDKKLNSSTFNLGGLYKCNENCHVKAKVSSSGIMNASYKQIFEKKLTVVNSVELPYQLNSWKWGIAATLG